MSIFIKRVKYYSRDLRDMLCVIGSFFLGWCSWKKMRAYVYEAIRYKLNARAEKKGKRIITHFNGKKIMDTDEANNFIGNAIISGRPFMAARFGTIELEAMWRTRDDGKGFITPIDDFMNLFCNNTGFFPKDKKLMPKFAQLMKDTTQGVDLMTIREGAMGEYEAVTYGKSSMEFCSLAACEPFFTNNSWTAKLENKKVLVIHPFYKSIPAQYEKRELLFPGKNILPKFDLIMQRAVQTMCYNNDERFSDWFDALEYMYDQAMQKDFDVAVIGCGAYGYPLAAKIKRAGKIAMHLGGWTQLLFGIKGARWENAQDYYRKLLDNPAWVRPLPEEVPQNFKTIENGAYW